MPEKPVSEKELERRLMEGEVKEEDLPKPPEGDPETKADPKVVMEDENPKGFGKIMDDLTEKDPKAAGAREEDPQTLRNIERLLTSLPDRIAQSLGAD
jgi:hypothetical protein